MSLLAETSKEPAGNAETWFVGSHPRTMGLVPEADLEPETIWLLRCWLTAGKQVLFVRGRAGKACAGKRSMNGSQYRRCGQYKERKAGKSPIILLPQMASVNILLYCFPVIFYAQS